MGKICGHTFYQYIGQKLGIVKLRIWKIIITFNPSSYFSLLFDQQDYNQIFVNEVSYNGYLVYNSITKLKCIHTYNPVQFEKEIMDSLFSNYDMARQMTMLGLGISTNILLVHVTTMQFKLTKVMQILHRAIKMRPFSTNMNKNREFLCLNISFILLFAFIYITFKHFKSLNGFINKREWIFRDCIISQQKFLR